ncbi:uncharacterized protein LOC116341656 [Contarinia nasturtii]|uniref:uncharacterized protein LOC116341656 n=1 Tax=Contarinia nasturtii TaxID=265458 RepID=UPI0012D38180|nr:uncharacterized protein LOC116341656 [Contarinia nasturtii]
MLYLRRLLAIALIVLSISTLSKCSEVGPSGAGSSAHAEDVDNLTEQFNRMRNRREQQERDAIVRGTNELVLEMMRNSDGEDRAELIRAVKKDWKHITPRSFRDQIQAAVGLDSKGNVKKKKK